MKKILKNKKIFALGFILGAFIFGTTGVLAVTYYAGKDVTYDNTESGMTSENVQDAIDELYVKAFPPIYGSDLVKQVGTVTSGDGLYVDSYEENIYTYRGSNPNNYVTFNGESWRIISINIAKNTIMIIRSSVLENKTFDTNSNGRYNSSQYCSSSVGCNIYGSTSSLYNSSGSAISTLARKVNGAKYQLPSKESEMSTYLNETYYNSLNTIARSMVVEGEYKAGPINNSNSQSLSTEIGYASEAIWKGKVALIDATEYVRASTNSNCTNIDNGWDGYCANNNWMNIGDRYWTMSPYSSSYSVSVLSVVGGSLYYIGMDFADGVRPVVYLSPEVQITGGDGTSSNPYILGV